MNIQLARVLSEIMGVPGPTIVRAIVVGEREALRLAQMRNRADKSSEAMSAKALTGSWKDEPVFVLTHEQCEHAKGRSRRPLQRHTRLRE
jgi:transposase